MEYIPNYLKAYKEGKLEQKVERLNRILSCCTLCPRKCRVNRSKDERGFCGAGKDLRISSVVPHFGEESCLVGRSGSGTIFFSYCNLKCIFCQNYEISHLAEGYIVTKEKLADCMLNLQKLGCHNINLVTPTHFIPQILESLLLAVNPVRKKPSDDTGLSNGVKQELNIPLVYNCGGYESEEVIDILAGVVDIYMPDVKFSSQEVSEQLCRAADYFSNLKKVLKKMFEQVGDLEIEDGIAKRGLLIRHLILPKGLSGTKEIMEFISKHISPKTFINIMAQYRPCGEAYTLPELRHYISQQEYAEALRTARSFGLSRFD